jgi:hypothetical protein
MFIQRNSCIAYTLLLAVSGFVSAPAASAQNIPPTAREAAASPQFASRLAHRVTTPQRKPAHERGGVCRLPQKGQQTWPLDDELYSNGPINGTTDAWPINSGFVISDSFTGGGTAMGFTFGAWLLPGDVLQSAEISITSSEFGGTTYLDQTVNFTQTGCVSNQFGYNVRTETGTIYDTGLPSGTYWVNVQNARVDTGDPVYWDENSGPSMASDNSVGTIPFTVTGSGGIYPPCMSEQQAGSRSFMISAAEQTEQVLSGWLLIVQTTFTEQQTRPLVRSTNWRKPAQHGCSVRCTTSRGGTTASIPRESLSEKMEFCTAPPPGELATAILASHAA